MLNKAVGYSGFRTYGELAYPTRKQGKDLELSNKVWESTVRDVDHRNALDNFRNSDTVYKKSFLENTNPANYHPEHVPKGGARTLEFSQAGSIKAYDREEAQRYGGSNVGKNCDERKQQFLKSGVEHWKTNYQCMGGRANSTQKDPSNTVSQLRSTSVMNKSAHQIAEEEGRAKSYKNRPYMNNAKIGVSDYKFNYGEKIGSSPIDLMGRVSIRQPLRDHPLKRGTNQLWTQIPNYQGFKPSERSFKQIQERLDKRNEIAKGNVKLQVTENFLVNTPGYGGYKPQFQTQTAKLRENCLSTK